MEQLIEVDQLIKHAKSKSIDFGKGNPYNRLRYYTKIGLLPHMERKKNAKGNITGHYPAWTPQRLEYIEELKAEGLSNQEILKKVLAQDKMRSAKRIFGTSESRMKILTYATFIVLLFVLLVELGIIPIGQNKTQFVGQPAQLTQSPTIIANGSGFIPANQNRVFVKSADVAASSKINVTFNNDYAPATRFWISEIIPGRGFYMELDSRSYENAGFNWWISN